MIEAGSFTLNSYEFDTMARVVKSLNKHEARELKMLVGVKVVPGPDDEVKATFANALLKLADYKVKRIRVKSGGICSYKYEIDLRFPFYKRVLIHSTCFLGTPL